MERGVAVFGVVFLVVGLGTAYLIITYPQGLNPQWPIGMALLVPAAFALGGLHMIAAGLGFPALAARLLQAIVVALVAIVNWAAFFTTHIRCVATLSFFGVPFMAHYPTEVACRTSLQVITACIDALVVIPIVWFAWCQRRGRQRGTAGD